MLGELILYAREKIVDDVEFISHIRNVFDTLQNILGAFLPDCLQENLNKKIQGSVFQSFPTKPTTDGNAYPMQICTTNYVQDPNILDNFSCHCSVNEMVKKIHAKHCLLSSQNISNHSTEISYQNFKLQQKHKNINSFSCVVIIGLSSHLQDYKSEIAQLKVLAANHDTRKRLIEFVCRLVRHIGSEINLKALCQNLLHPWMAMINQIESLKVAWFTGIIELVTVYFFYTQL
ncbi:hypothetical protein SUGI_0460900 [Cryptomeria japonica]|nr:hypothetical protein SUGI_0460900 [Cryptomeria japonica]